MEGNRERASRARRTRLVVAQTRLGVLQCRLFSAWLAGGEFGRPLALVVVDNVLHAEHRPQSAAVWQSLERPELARVGVDHDVGFPARAERQEARGLLGAVYQLVSAVLAAWERHHLALLQIAPPLRRAQAGGSCEH